MGVVAPGKKWPVYGLMTETSSQWGK